jgi:hypothetical protein
MRQNWGGVCQVGGHEIIMCIYVRDDRRRSKDIVPWPSISHGFLP